MGLAQRVFALFAVGAAAVGFAGVARPADQPFVIRVAPDPPTVGGETLPGYSLTISSSGGLDPAVHFDVGSSSPPPSPPPTAPPAAPASSSSQPAATSSTPPPATPPPASTPVTSSAPASPPSSSQPAVLPVAPAKPASRPPDDKKHPVVNVFEATGTLLHSLRLHFRVADNSGKAALALGLYKGKRTIAWHTTPLKLVSARRSYFLTWKPKLAGDYLFCVGALDAAGNRRSDCAKVTIHR